MSFIAHFIILFNRIIISTADKQWTESTARKKK